MKVQAGATYKVRYMRFTPICANTTSAECSVIKIISTYMVQTSKTTLTNTVDVMLSHTTLQGHPTVMHAL